MVADRILMDMSPSPGGNRPLENTYWVVPGRLAAGEYPGDKIRRKAAGKLRTLLEKGFDCFIDLTESGELEPYAGMAEAEASRLGVSFEHQRHPIVDASVPRSPQNTIGILDAIDQALLHGKTVYLHCWGGVGRTGTVVGCWLVRHGRTGEEALAQIAQWWKGMEKADRYPRSPETWKQHAYVRHWTEPPRGDAGRVRT